MQQTQTPPPSPPSDQKPKVEYTWKRGCFFYRIERHFHPDGQREVITIIPRWYHDAEWLANQMIRGLTWGELFDRP